MNNGFEIIDSHCHIYPDKIAQAASDHTGEFYDIKMRYDGTVSALLADGEKSGVDRYIVQSVAVTPKQVSSINKYIAGEVASSGGKFVGLGTLHPLSENMEAEFEEILSLGLCGVKLHPDMQEFAIDDPAHLEMYRLCEGKIPMLIHMGDPRSDLSHPRRLRRVMEMFPELTVIAAHLGGYSLYEEAVQILWDLPRIFVDCSSSLPFLDDQRATNIIRRYGADRVLFGTDYPMWDIEKEIRRVLSLPLSDSEKRAIFAENAKELFSL